jgi:hypothetical protein
MDAAVDAAEIDIPNDNEAYDAFSDEQMYEIMNGLLIGDYEGDGEEVLEEEVQQVLEPPMLRYLSFLKKESSKRYSNRIILFKEWCVKGATTSHRLGHLSKKM